MNLHILTLNWNGHNLLQKLWPGLNKAIEYSLNNKQFNEVFWHVRDNGSTDDSVDFLNTLPRTKVYQIAHNRDNFATGMNYLFERANPNLDDVILFLNNDIIIEDDKCISKLMNLLCKDEVGVVGCRLLYTNTDKIQHAGVIFSKVYNELPYHYRPGQKADEESRKNRYFQAVTAACCMTKASNFIMVDGFDDSLSWAFDDIAYCLKIKYSGQKIAYLGDTLVYHNESESLKKNPVNKLFVNKNVTYFKNTYRHMYDLDYELYLIDPSYNVIQ